MVEKYVQEQDAVAKRLEEQIVSGNIQKTKNGYQITEQGQSVVKMYLMMAEVFAIDQKNINPQLE